MSGMKLYKELIFKQSYPNAYCIQFYSGFGFEYKVQMVNKVDYYPVARFYE